MIEHFFAPLKPNYSIRTKLPLKNPPIPQVCKWAWSGTAHDTGLSVLEGAGQGCLLPLPLCLSLLPVLLRLLEQLLVHRELYGIGSWSGAQVVHPSLQTLLWGHLEIFIIQEIHVHTQATHTCTHTYTYCTQRTLYSIMYV